MTLGTSMIDVLSFSNNNSDCSTVAKTLCAKNKYNSATSTSCSSETASLGASLMSSRIARGQSRIYRSEVYDTIAGYTCSNRSMAGHNDSHRVWTCRSISQSTKLQNSCNSARRLAQGRGYNTEFLLYPRPLRWWKYFCCFICVTLLWALHIVIKHQFFIFIHDKE